MKLKLLLLSISAACAIAHADEMSALDYVKNFYSSYVKSNYERSYKENADEFFTPELKASYVRVFEDGTEEGDVGTFDYDVIVDCQDPEGLGPFEYDVTDTKGSYTAVRIRNSTKEIPDKCMIVKQEGDALRISDFYSLKKPDLEYWDNAASECTVLDREPLADLLKICEDK